MMKISLVLSGGASRGAFHLGVLQAFMEKGIEVEAISGSSIGAIIAMSFASGVTPKKQLAIFKSKAFKKSFKFNYFRGGLLRINHKNPLFNELVPLKYIEEAKIPTYVCSVDLHEGQVLYFDKGDAITLCIASSCVIPLFKPLKYKQFHLVDGGVMNNLPIEPLLRYSNPVVGVDLHPLSQSVTSSLWSIIKRTLFLVWRAPTQEQIKGCDYYISSPKLSQYNIFSFKKLDAMFDLGYEEAMQHQLCRESSL